MSSYQRVVICGNLGQDPECRATPGGDCITNLSIATSESWKDKQTGEKKEKTEWHRCVAFRRTAEVIRDYCHKGDKILVEGKLQTRSWEDKNTGEKKYSTEVLIDNMTMLGSKSEGAGHPAGPQTEMGRASAAAARKAPAPIPDLAEDDIPF